MTEPALSLADVLQRDTLVDRRGRSYRRWRVTQTPRYGRVWAALLGGHVALLLGAGALWAVGSSLPGLLLALAVGAPWIGYWIHYLHLFIHEAAHYNLLPDRRWNDRVANLLLGILTGIDVRRWRVVHFAHHRQLGTPRDPERSYFEPLNRRFVVESLTGVRAARVLLRWARASREGERREAPSWVVLYAVAANGAIVLGAFFSGHLALAIGWILGVAVGLPFFMSVRQQLEHRSAQARDDVDYAVVEHGPVNRLFGSGPLASTLGGAGFNRHLLHHWDPQLSCTRLAELEAYLLDTEAADLVRRHRTSYAATLRELLH